jgi:hypothetical protein
MNLQPEIFEFLKKLKKTTTGHGLKTTSLFLISIILMLKNISVIFLISTKTILIGNPLKFLEFIKMFDFLKIKHRIKPILQ